MMYLWGFLRYEPLKRETYAKRPNGEEKENAARKLLKPLYVMSTARGDCCETILDFLAEERGE